MEAAGTHHTVPLELSLIEAGRSASGYNRPNSTTVVYAMTPSIYDASATNGPDPESLLIEINTTMKQKLSFVVSSNGALDLTGLKPSERALALDGATAPPIEAFFMSDPAATPKPIPPPLNMHTPPAPSSLLRRMTDHTGELASMTHANVLDLHQLQALTPWDHDAHPIPPVPRRSDTASQTTFNEYKAAVLQDRLTAELTAYGAAVQAHTQANRAASEAYVAAHTAFVADFWNSLIVSPLERG